jgi:hypothetical protein
VPPRSRGAPCGHGRAARHRRATREAARARGAGRRQSPGGRIRSLRLRRLPVLSRRLVSGDGGGSIYPSDLRPDARRRHDARAAQPGHDVHLCVGHEHRQQRARPHDVGAGEGENGERVAAAAVPGGVHVPPGSDSSAPRYHVEDDVDPCPLRTDQAPPSSAPRAPAKLRDDDGGSWAGDDRGRSKRLRQTRSRDAGHQQDGT